eukprot:jgi/Botrbrau1/18174/Bobra.53_1s0042.1
MARPKDPRLCNMKKRFQRNIWTSSCERILAAFAKRHGRGGSPITISDLPQDALVSILRQLDRQTLLTARLVCPAWRAASLLVVTRLCLRPSGKVVVEDGIYPPLLHGPWGPYRWLPSANTLASRLRLFPCVSDLGLDIDWRGNLALLDVPGCRTKLKSLGLTAEGYDAAAFAGVTGLTHLALGGPLRHELVSQSAWLRVLLVGSSWSVTEWRDVLPLLAGLPNLRELGMLPLAEQVVVEGLAALTQLTAVKCNERRSERCGKLDPLTAIRGLRALSLGDSDGDGGVLERFLRSSPQLEELVLGRCFAGRCHEGVARPVGCLRRLTKLKLSMEKWPVERCVRGKPYELWCKARNRLELDCLVPPPAPLALYLTLEHLELGLHTDHYCGLRASIASLTRLTHLSLHLVDAFACDVFLMSNRTKGLAWRRADVVRALTRLQHLDLDLIPHGANVAADVRCLAGLTQLTYLRMGTYPYPGHMWFESDTAVRWKKLYTAFQASGGFLQLTALTGLSEICIEGCWWAITERDFVEPFNEMRRSLGRPPLKQYWW